MSRGLERLARRGHVLARPRPATLIALLALFMAMGGTSLAGSVLSGSALKNGSVSRKKIATNAIDSTRLAANSVTSGKLAKGAVGASKLATGAVTAAALAPGSVAGTNLAVGAVSWKSLGAQVVAAAPVTLPVPTSPAIIPVSATATCPAGSVAISGGQTVSDTANAFVIQSVQAGLVGAQAGLPGAAPTGWTSVGADAGVNAATMTVYAICISAGS
jgi:hypothetical protein